MNDSVLRSLVHVETALLKLERATKEPELKAEAEAIRMRFQQRRVALECVHDVARAGSDFGVGNE